MVIIILLNDIHSELISYCQSAIKQIKLCILTILKYFQFVLNFRARGKHWSDSPGKWKTNSKGSSSCTGFLLPPQGSIHRPVYLRSTDTARTFWCLTSDTVSLAPHSYSHLLLILLLQTWNLSSQMAVAAATVTIRNQTGWLLFSIITVLVRRKFAVANHWENLLSEDKSLSSSCSPFCHHATSEDSTPLWKQAGIRAASAAALHPTFVTRTPVR